MTEPSRHTGRKTQRTARTGHRMKGRGHTPPVRYAIVGLGHIAQAAVLPAFSHVRGAQLAALISDDKKKLSTLGRKYSVKAQYGYENLEECIRDEGIEAVYIAVPNSLHRQYTIRAAQAGAHVLCEKPLGVTTEECRQMIEAAERNSVYLMTAYRLHFDQANLEAVRLLHQGKIGEPLLFSSVFAFQVQEQNIRLQRELGGGALLDIGIYCINAARYVFQDEPESVFGQMIYGQDARFSDVEGSCSAILQFPDKRLAQFTCSFATAPAGYYEVSGTKGQMCLDPAYEYEESLAMELTVRGKHSRRKFKRSDQFAAELEYFAECIRKNEPPEPDGYEGLADLRIIEAIRDSAHNGNVVTLPPFEIPTYPEPSQARQEPPPRGNPPLVHVSSPSVN